jgi:hypothetical protein
VVIGADNPAEEIRQRERLKKELASMEVEKTSPTEADKKEPSNLLKEQISQAIKENQQAQKTAAK